jgi:hypothetical protein
MSEPKYRLEDITMDIEGFLQCVDPDHQGERNWCGHLKAYIESGKDAAILHPDSHIQVPIYPKADIFGYVWIGVDTGDGSALMSLNFTPDIGKPYSVQLGFWNPGEGMISIREVILDYIRSRTHPDENFGAGFTPIKTSCPASTHGVHESKIVAEKSAENLQWKWQCLWNMVMEKACTPCLELTAGAGDGNFGIDQSVIPGRRS